MIDGKAIKKVTLTACAIHQLARCSIIRFRDGAFVEGAHNVTEEGQELRIKGELHPVQLRRWLFDRRKHPVFGRDPVLWTGFDEETNEHVAGLAEVGSG